MYQFNFSSHRPNHFLNFTWRCWTVLLPRMWPWLCSEHHDYYLLPVSTRISIQLSSPVHPKHLQPYLWFQSKAFTMMWWASMRRSFFCCCVSRSNVRPLHPPSATHSLIMYGQMLYDNYIHSFQQLSPTHHNGPLLLSCIWVSWLASVNQQACGTCHCYSSGHGDLHIDRAPIL